MPKCLFVGAASNLQRIEAFIHRRVFKWHTYWRFFLSDSWMCWFWGKLLEINRQPSISGNFYVFFSLKALRRQASSQRGRRVMVGMAVETETRKILPHAMCKYIWNTRLENRHVATPWQFHHSVYINARYTYEFSNYGRVGSYDAEILLCEVEIRCSLLTLTRGDGHTSS